MTTPSLAEQFRQRPEDLPALVKYIAAKVTGPDWADGLAEQALVWIARELGRDYAWPGNIRELEQYVRGVMLRGNEAPRPVAPAISEPSWLEGANACSLTADNLLGRYCTWAYFRLGTYERAAEQLGVDRLTVKARIDTGLLARLKDQVREQSPTSGS